MLTQALPALSALLVSAGFLLSGPGPASAAEQPAPVLVKNIQGLTSQADLSPTVRVALGNQVLMTAHNALHGNELWISDGSATGTRLVKDIRRGPESSDPTSITVSGNRAFFIARSGPDNPRIWLTDGTEAGTREVALPYPAQIEHTVLDRTVYPCGTGVVFSVFLSLSARQELWFSDGTVTGTRRIHATASMGEAAGNAPNVRWATSTGRMVFFFRTDAPQTSLELWRTDGTEKGTLLVKRVAQPVQPPNLMLGHLNGQAFFAVHQKDRSVELWKSNGTEKGTVRVRTLAEENTEEPTALVTVAGKGYFLASTRTSDNQPVRSKEIWVTDGTEKGTRRLSEATGLRLPDHAYPVLLNAMGSRLLVHYQQLNEGEGLETGIGLWSADVAKKTGSVLLDPALFPDAQRSLYLASTDTRAFFTTESSAGVHLWVTDGTTAGTRHAAPALAPGGEASPMVESGEPPLAQLVIAGSTAYFRALSLTSGEELWKSDGTSEGTGLVLNHTPDSDSYPAQLQATSGHLYFSAVDGVHGRELWRTDGTEAGTHLVADIVPGPDSSIPEGMTEFEGIVYFTAGDAESGRELWRTDGTEAGTWRVKDISPGPGSSNPHEFCAFKGRLYFQAADEQGAELWVTDGTAEGTQRFVDLSSGAGGSGPRQLTVMGDWLYFTAYPASAQGEKLIRTDGSPENTEVIAAEFDSPKALTVRPPVPGAYVDPQNPVLYFVASYSGDSLWRCANGELPVRVHTSGASNFYKQPRLILGKDGWLVMQDSLGYIWWSDGRVGSSHKRLGNLQLNLFSRSKNRLFFRNNKHQLSSSDIDGDDWQEWSIGEPYLGAQPLFSEGGVLFFAQEFPAATWRLWKMTGQGQAEPVSDLLLPIRPSSTSLDYPYPPASDFETARVGNRVYFSGIDPELGVELHALEVSTRLELELSQILNGGYLPLQNGGSVHVRFSAEADQPVPAFSLLLRNTGSVPIPDVTLVHTPVGPGSMPISVGTLAVGEAHAIYVTNTAPGQRLTTLEIRSSDPRFETQTLQLISPAVSSSQPPQIHLPYGSRLVLTGDSVPFEAFTAPQASLVSQVWKLGSRQMATAPFFMIEPVTMQHVGTYTLTVISQVSPTKRTTLVSAPTRLAVVQRAPATARSVEGQPLSLTCVAKAPAGCQLTYQWLLNGQELSDAYERTGSRSSVLKLTALRAESEGDYDCRVTLHAPDGIMSVRHGVTRVTRQGRPILYPQAMESLVGTEVNHPISFDVLDPQDPPTLFTAKGLPPGLKIDTSTGLITGRPLRPSGKAGDTWWYSAAPYQVTVTARNKAGISDPITFPWLITTFLPPGTWHTALERNTEMDGGLGLGGRLQITVTLSGAFSGQLIYGGKTYRLTSSQLSVTTTDGTGLLGVITLPLGRDAGNLTLSLDRNGRYLTANLEDPSGYSTSGSLGYQRFSAQNPASLYAGAYTCRMQPTELLEGIPQGNGFLTASISLTGAVTWKGKLADGTAITGSSALTGEESWNEEPEGQYNFILYQPLYPVAGKPTGSLLGSLSGSHQASPILGQIDLFGVVSVSKSGLPLNVMHCEGGQYRAPAAGELLMGLEPGSDNALFKLYRPSPGPDFFTLNQPFTLTDKHKAVFPAVDAEHPLKALTFNAATGTFTGSVVIVHPDDDRLNRTATFEGVIIPNLGASYGYLLLPDLPAEGRPASDLKTTPRRSVSAQVGIPEF